MSVDSWNNKRSNVRRSKLTTVGSCDEFTVFNQVICHFSDLFLFQWCHLFLGQLFSLLHLAWLCGTIKTTGPLAVACALTGPWVRHSKKISSWQQHHSWLLVTSNYEIKITAPKSTKNILNTDGFKGVSCKRKVWDFDGELSDDKPHQNIRRVHGHGLRQQTINVISTHRSKKSTLLRYSQCAFVSSLYPTVWWA